MQKMQTGRPVIVTEPVMRPNHCALTPHITRDPDGFIDTGTRLTGFQPRVYISMSGFRDLALSLGYPTPQERHELQEQIAGLQERVEELEAAVAEKDAALNAVAVLKQAGYSAQRRPAAKTKAAA